MEAAKKETGIAWKPFQCPACYGVFRVQRLNAGRVGQCPLCKMKLLIPGELVKSPSPVKADLAKVQPFVAKEAVILTPEEAEEGHWDDGENQQKRRHFSNSQKQAKLDWEEAPGEKLVKSLPLAHIIGAILALLFLGGGAILYLKHFSENPEADIVSEEDSFKSREEMIAFNESLALDTSNIETTELINQYEDVYRKFDLAKLTQAVKSFLSAETEEEKVKFCIGRENELPKILDFYQSRQYQPEGFNEIQLQEMWHQGQYVQFRVVTGDFSVRVMTAALVEDEYLIHWQSWVGYNKVSVESMMKLKPTQPFEVRATLIRANYYNYRFSDDEKWESYKLLFELSDTEIWGYVDRSSKYFRELSESGVSKGIFEISYPEKGARKDQVIIKKLIAPSWLKIE